MKICALFSGGKDSTYAAWLLSNEHEISCLLTLNSENKESYMFHTANIEMTKTQAKLMGIPLFFKKTKGIKEDELKDIEEGLREMKKRFRISGITTGAVASEYQKSRIEKICKKIGLECISPLWNRNPEEVLTEMIDNGFEIIITAVAAEGLEKEWLGRKIDENSLKEIKEIKKKYRIHLMGEGGEYETLVTNCPLFSSKIIIEKSERIWDDKTRSGELIIKKISLKSK